MVVRPRWPGTFLYWARCTDAELRADLTTSDGSQVPTGRAEDLAHLSRRARAKFTGLRVAVDLTATALVVPAAALVTAALH
ncbi:hypothetical protein C6N75_02945 [Streptomyces solincola]|uniref:Pycsar effector protein domain-containing protein n=1 Tax=Streptomyces solincola TaxID=2100817 RepID=A0A2S9Q1V5_9ACTN|nr:Pycsar system effector family protein [Streptomyces solincola]PRH80649.1 hypothetical protein C6N75_02945 [Streptomyces solincola]